MASVTGFLTGGLIDPSGPKYGKKMAAAEARRQGQLTTGMNLIDAVFRGGTAPLYTPVLDTFSKDAWQQSGGKLGTYFKINKKGEYESYYGPKKPKEKGVGDLLLDSASPFAPIFTANFLGGLFGGAPSPRELVNKEIKRGNLFTKEDKTFQGFDDDFFAQRAQDWVRFAMPQFSDQYRNAMAATTYGLSNRGLLESTQATKARSDVNRAAVQGQQQILDEGRRQEQSLRQDVENARDRAIGMLYQTADPSQGLRTAIASASNFSTPPIFTPITNMFSNIANQYYMSQVLNAYRNVPTYTVPNMTNPSAAALPKNEGGN
jgi:hypothetical protein